MVAKKIFIILLTFTSSFSYSLAWFGEDLFQSAENAVEGVASEAEKAADGVVSGVKDAANEFGQVVQDGAQEVEDTAQKIGNFVKEGADAAGEMLLNGVEDVWGGAKDVANSKVFEYTTLAISLALLVIPGAGEAAVAAEALELGADGDMAADVVEGAEAVSDGVDAIGGTEAVADGADVAEGTEAVSDVKQGRSFLNLIKSTIKEAKSIPKRIVTHFTGDLIRSNVSREVLEGIEGFSDVYESVDLFNAVKDGINDKSNGDSTVGAVGKTIESYFSPF